MAQQTINVGTAPNDGTGTPLRTAFQYTNSNFSELYTAVGPSGNNIVVPGNATITGDLTVDTSTLKVDSANNYVGIGTASPVQSLTISGEASVRVNDLIYWNGYYNAGFKARAAGYAAYIGEAASGDFVIANTASSAAGAGSSLSFLERYRINNSGVHTWENVGGVAGTAMTLNANGLGIGVTPSAWNSDLRALQVSSSGSYVTSYISGATVNQWLFIGNNAFYDSVDSRWEYIRSKPSAQYIQYNNEHQWLRDTGTQTAGAACTFTQAMTLDASGNLLVGTTSASTTSGSGFKVTQPAAGHFDASIVTSANSSIYSCWDIYSTGGTAGYRFYVTSNGTINAVNTTISAISDARLKENVQDIDVGLGAILALKPRKFDWKEGKGKNIKGDRGFIAQEFEQVFPQLVDEWKDAAPEGEAPYKSVRQDLIPVLVKAIQELTARVQTLETR